MVVVYNSTYNNPTSPTFSTLPPIDPLHPIFLPISPLSPRLLSYTYAAALKEPPTLPRLNAVLNHRSVLIGIKSAGARHRARHRAIQCIEALALDLGPDPQEGDAERAGTEGPEETAKGRGDKGACNNSKLCTKQHDSSWNCRGTYQTRSSRRRTVRLLGAEGAPRAACRRRSRRVRRGRW